MSDAEKLARAVLMFFNGKPWSIEDARMWKDVTGQDDATTRVLCDLAREVKAAEERNHAASI